MEVSAGSHPVTLPVRDTTPFHVTVTARGGSDDVRASVTVEINLPPAQARILARQILDAADRADRRAWDR